MYIHVHHYVYLSVLHMRIYIQYMYLSCIYMYMYIIPNGTYLVPGDTTARGFPVSNAAMFPMANP